MNSSNDNNTFFSASTILSTTENDAVFLSSWKKQTKNHEVWVSNHHFLWGIDNIINMLSHEEKGWNVADNIFKCILLNEKFWIGNQISVKYISNGLLAN